MPELPEVETIRRQLAREIAGTRIAEVEILFGHRLHPSVAGFRRALTGAKIVSVGRRAKMLLFGLDNGQTMVAHLKMTGRFLIMPAGAAPTRHTHVIFGLKDGRRLFFEDIRKFGYLKAVPTAKLEEIIGGKEGLGPEPLEKTFTSDRLGSCLLARPGRKIKPSLMDQSCVAGIGNIYADEALWRAGILPTRRIKDLTAAEVRRLRKGIIESLRSSLRLGGTSADDYVDLYGKRGKNQLKLKVYGREGGRCLRCGGSIRKIRLAGRSAHFCPKCQS